MQAVVQHHLGEAPRFTTFHDPEPQDGEVIVRAGAAWIRPTDLAISRGHHARTPLALPHVCGRDGIGYLSDGQRVYYRACRAPFGAMAEAVPADWVVPVPEGIDTTMAAALTGPALTAWMPLAVRADMAPGETVLVLGASGSVGRLAVQAARLQGAGRIIAAAHRVDLLAMLGADALIDLGQPPSMLQHAFATYAADGIDVVLDFVWGETLELLLAALIEMGGEPLLDGDRGIRVVSVADRGAGSLMIAPTALRDSRVAMLGCGPANHPPGEELTLMLEEIFACMRDGDLVLEADRMPMSEANAAWRLAAEYDRRIVLTLD